MLNVKLIQNQECLTSLSNLTFFQKVMLTRQHLHVVLCQQEL